jgi:hypothetical protein
MGHRVHFSAALHAAVGDNGQGLFFDKFAAQTASAPAFPHNPATITITAV